ncbi:MAG: murein biosynthesis integral membrane protein MurJ [Caldilinea sp.]
MTHARFLVRSSAVVMLFYGLSRLTGFVKLLLMTQWFGIGAAADAFAAAYQFPELLVSMLSGGAVAAAFVPVYTAALVARERASAERLAAAVVTLTAVGMGGVSLAVLCGAPWLTATLLAPGFSPEQQQLTAQLIQVLMVAMFFYAVGSVYANILQAHDHFVTPALGTVLIDLGQILGVWLLARQWGIVSAAWGLVVGAWMILAVQAPALKRLQIRLTWQFREPALANLWQLFWPRLVTIGAVQAADLLIVRLASGLTAGSLSAYFFALLIMASMPRGLFAQAIATVIFPTMARQYNSGDLVTLRQTTTAGLCAALTLVIPAGAGILALGMPAMRFLFPGQALDSASLEMVYALVAILAVRLLADSAVDVLSLVLYARHNTRLPMWASLGWVLALGLLSLWLVGPLGIYGVAWASSLASAGLAAAYFWVVGISLQGIDGRMLLRTLAQSAGAALLMVAALWLLARAGLADTLFVAAGGLGGAVVYLGVHVVLNRGQLTRWLQQL